MIHFFFLFLVKVSIEIAAKVIDVDAIAIVDDRAAISAVTDTHSIAVVPSVSPAIAPATPPAFSLLLLS